ncbi:MAG: undecaprenyldiphospho-muramoylpentapeptide beta-N-acetylglucosaminyltransferase [Ignavibacteriales bacterium]|nr:undecaprenyldiphospho-muramoylpentapeptide beta-N-acetylglucosaminyltransferase [Ignavibacteriales bacterium]
MKNQKNKYRFLFAAGGTGGHLYPAIAIAEKIRVLLPSADIMFIGTKKKLEARVVPQYKFKFKTIWISGFSRKLNFSNFLFPIKLIIASIKSLWICFKFKPQVAIGCGAYLSGPVIWAAKLFGAKIILQEQNSYPGVTNRMLEKKADQIHISFEDSKKYFKNQSKLIMTGNPIRIDIKLKEKSEALREFGLSNNKKTLFVFGGSLGALSINQAIEQNLKSLLDINIQVIWQTGKFYFEIYQKYENECVRIMAYIENMSNAYSAADLILARSGATTIAEIAYLALPVIFVPSPNVAENHQYKNAKSLIDNNSALMIEDKNLSSELINTVEKTIFSSNKLKELGNNIKKFSIPEAAEVIAKEALKLAKVEIK